MIPSGIHASHHGCCGGDKYLKLDGVDRIMVDEDVVLGKRVKIYSEILGEERSLFVRLLQDMRIRR